MNRANIVALTELLGRATTEHLADADKGWPIIAETLASYGVLVPSVLTKDERAFLLTRTLPTFQGTQNDEHILVRELERIAKGEGPGFR